MTDKKQEEKIIKSVKKEEVATKPKGRYISTTGRRKSSTARVRLYKKGTGIMLVNDKDEAEHFSENEIAVYKQVLKLTNHLKDLDFSIVVNGGGLKGQADAIRHGISRGLIEMDEELKLPIKAKGWLTRDARIKERKKPGLKKARRAPQWSKR